MRKRLGILLNLVLLFFPPAICALTWRDLWLTADQQAVKLLQAGHPDQAAQRFKNQDWKAIADYRAGNFNQALRYFRSKNTSDGQYNAGNAAAQLGRFEQALAYYEKALILNPNNSDAKINKEIIKKLLDKKQQESKACPKNNPNSKTENDNKNQQQASNNKPQGNQSSSDKNASRNETNNKRDGKDKTNQAETKQAQDTKQDRTNQAETKQAQDTKQEHSAGANKDAKARTQDANTQQADQQQDSKVSQQSLRYNQTEENKNQLMRRLSEDPGGLLRRKFLRDYIRRHASEVNPGVY